MANEIHIAIWRQGKEAWNNWRKENPEEPADFSGTDFSSYDTVSFEGFNIGDKAKFNNAYFGDSVKFDNAIFGYSTTFSHAQFGKELSFQNAKFGSNINFQNVTTGYNARFWGTQFGDQASFNESTFGDYTDFSNAHFDDLVLFENVKFGVTPRFIKTNFGEMCSFKNSKFKESADFHEAIFGQWSDFVGTNFGDWTNFTEVSFNGNSNFSGISNNQKSQAFPRIDFSKSHFKGSASFYNRSFNGPLYFNGTKFNNPPDFRKCNNYNLLDLTGIVVNVSGSLQFLKTNFSISTPNWTSNTEYVDAIRRLRKIASDFHHHDLERDLFILERQAERGELWKTQWKQPWIPLGRTLLVWLYGFSSDYGRSLVQPLIWLFMTQFIFNDFYHLAAKKGGTYTMDISNSFPFLSWSWKEFDPQVLSFTIAQAFPYATTIKTSAADALAMFGDKLPMVQGWSVVHGLLSTLFLFLALLAVRNFFKVK